MTSQQYQRFNALSEKLMDETATKAEQDEFAQLLAAWNNHRNLNNSTQSTG